MCSKCARERIALCTRHIAIFFLLSNNGDEFTSVPYEVKFSIGELPTNKNQHENADPQGYVKVWNPWAQTCADYNNSHKANFAVQK
jgi:hypothetical protein